MSGTKYPYQIDGASELPITTDNVTAVKAEVVNNLRAAIIAIEAELGIDPSREYSTVRARLDAMAAIIAALQAVSGGGNANLTTLPPVNITKSPAQVGTIQLAALSDHKHDVSTASATTIGTTNSEGNSSSLARADHTHAVSGLNIVGQQRGSILYFNGTSWVILNPSTDGYVLTTHSTGADPTWTSGSNVSLTNSTPANVTKSAAVVGIATTAARADHKHDVTTAVPSNIGNANTEGSATSLARSDHIHALAGTVGGDLSGTLPNPTVVNFHIPGATTNSILYYNGTAWVVLNAGQDGYVLTTHSVGAPPQWTSLPEGVGLGVVAPTDVDKNPAVIGVSARSAHEDHKHSIVTASAVSVGAANTEGTAISMARSDHKHAVTDLNMTSQVQGSIIYFNGTNWIVLNPSTDGYVLTTHSTGANPTWTAAPTGITLSNINPINVNASAAAVGILGTAARSDHKHNIDVGTAVSIGATNSAGTSTNLIRSDHTHAVVDLNMTGQTQGSIIYFNGTNWVTLAPGTNGAVLTTHSVSANPTWSILDSSSIVNVSTVTGATVTNALNTLNVTISGLPTLSVFNPLNVSKSNALLGTSTRAAREDHKHDIDTQTAISIGASNTEGVATTLARSDHTHAVTNLSIVGQVQGDTLYFNGTAWVRLPPSTDGFILTTHGTNANPTWSAAPTGVTLSGLLPVDVDANPALVGTGVFAARNDHKHSIATGIGTSIGAINAIGSSISLSRSDHKHAVIDLAIAGQVQGDIIYFNGANWVRLPAGTSGYVLTTNSVGANPSWSPAATLTSAAPVNVNASPALVGVATTAARADHKHDIDANVTPLSIGAINSIGSSSSLSRSDHKHAVTDLNMTSQVQGSIIYFNGTNWIVLPPSTDGFILTTHSTGANPTWTAAPTGITLTSSAPINVDANPAVVGVATTAARADHKHSITTGVAVNISNVNAAGTAISLARSDHTHAGVFSFNGRLGAVVPAGGDYNSNQITNTSSTVGGPTVSAALDILFARDTTQYKGIVLISTNRVLQIQDAGKLIIVTANGCTITIPTNSAVSFPIGTQISITLSVPSSTVFYGLFINVNTPATISSYSDFLRFCQPRIIYNLIKTDVDNWIIEGPPKNSTEILNDSIVPAIDPDNPSINNTTTAALNYLKLKTDLSVGAFNGISIPIIPLLGTSGWFGGITNDYQGSNVGGALGVAIPLYPGFTLKTIIVSIEPNTGHGGVLPSGMPFIQLWATNQAAHVPASLIASVADTSGSAAAYENQHSLSLTGLTITTLNCDSLWLRINDETGGVFGLKLKWIKAFYS